MYTIDDIINFTIYLPSSSEAMADRGKKGKMEIQKFEYLVNEQSFLDETKSIFHNYLGLSFGEEMIKIADIGFKICNSDFNHITTAY